MFQLNHDQVKSKSCSNCGAVFSCGANLEGGSCWCGELPAIMSVSPEKDCLCSRCLTEIIQQKIENLISSLSLDEAIAIARQYAKPGPSLQGIDYQLEEGNWVFTRWYHLKRGYCCGNACRHCPYNHQAC